MIASKMCFEHSIATQTLRVTTLNVLITFDVEVWCNGWKTLDKDFPSSFERYVFGHSPSGNHALPQALETLARHDLKAVFFVEPLFAARFGVEYLATIIDLISSAGQEVQLHLHPEWTDEAVMPLLPDITHKRQFLTAYNAQEQQQLIAHGMRLFKDAGATRPTAFRSGNFSCNADTFEALAANGLKFDSSINPEMAASHHHAVIPEGASPYEVFQLGELTCVPMSSFRDGFGRPRHAQLNACSAEELIEALIAAERDQWRTFVLLSHGDELMVPNRNRADPTVVRRFEKLCRFLAANCETLPTTGFNDLPRQPLPRKLPLPQVGKFATSKRFVEQAYRRIHL